MENSKEDLVDLKDVLQRIQRKLDRERAIEAQENAKRWQKENKEIINNRLKRAKDI